jgi:DNA-binding response OmpR family regulator
MLVVGSLGSAEQSHIIAAAREAGIEIDLVENPQTALGLLEMVEPEAILVDASFPSAERIFAHARAKRTLAGTPMIALSDDLTDFEFARAFRWGADDLVPRRGAAELLARLAVLPPRRVVPPNRGHALVADADHSRCEILGRVLTNAGYEVRYAIDARTAEYYLVQPGLRLVIANADIADPMKLVELSKRGDGTPTFIFSARPSQLQRHADRVRGVPKVATVSAFAPPDNVLFLANEVGSGQGTQARASRRLLYGTVVRFRQEGALDDDHGFTYNIAASGMFVRTLVPPSGLLVWADVVPPHTKRMVRLRGEIRWRRTFGPSETATSPPGFGLKILDGLGGDVNLWVDACARMDSAQREGNVTYSLPPGADDDPDSMPTSAEAHGEGVNAGRASAQPSPASVPPASARPVAPVAPVAPVVIARRDARSKILLVALAAALLATGAVVMRTTPARVASSTPTAAALKPTPPPRPEPPASAEPARAPPASSALAAVASAEAERSAPPRAPSTSELSSLAPDQGYLLVESSTDTGVSVHGVDAGRTNEWNQVRCGARFIRLGRSPKWETAGRVELVACRSTTRIRVDVSH